MTKGTKVEIRDLVSDYCPACDHTKLEFDCTSIGGNNVYRIITYVLRCEHQAVCRLRKEYMEEVDA